MFTPEVTFERQEDANKAVQDIREIVATYGQASVRDFYELVGVRGSKRDDKYGWLLIEGVRIRHRLFDDKYEISMTDPQPLKGK